MPRHEVNCDVNVKIVRQGKRGFPDPDEGAIIAALEEHLKGACLYVGAHSVVYEIEAAEHGGYLFTLSEGKT